MDKEYSLDRIQANAGSADGAVQVRQFGYVAKGNRHRQRYRHGTSKVYYTNEAGEAVELDHTFLVIFKEDKADARWRIHREVASAVEE